MAECEFCDEAIVDPEKAIFDGDHWFCTHQCLGKWATLQSGNVPA